LGLFESYDDASATAIIARQSTTLNDLLVEGWLDGYSGRPAGLSQRSTPARHGHISEKAKKEVGFQLPLRKQEP